MNFNSKNYFGFLSLLFLILAYSGVAKPTAIARSEKSDKSDNFLQPYIDKIEKSLSAEDISNLEKISQDELVLLHTSLGMKVRNEWLRGEKKDQELVQYFLDKGINSPDDMSEIILNQLWQITQKKIDPSKLKEIESRRKLRAEASNVYESIIKECSSKLESQKENLKKCVSKGSLDLSGVREITILNSGNIINASFTTNYSDREKKCFLDVMKKIKLSSFKIKSEVHAFVVSNFNCDLEERSEVIDLSKF